MMKLNVLNTAVFCHILAMASGAAGKYCTANRRFPYNRLSWEDPYDYIIVGAGTAGCVLATRLSEDPTVRVLLIEAGIDDDSDCYSHLEIPMHFTKLQLDSKFDWMYMTTPQNYSCKALKSHQSAWPRGKILGGTSTINTMVYTRGNSADYDEWEQMGAKYWNYASVLPYFKKSEHYNDLDGDVNYHGYGGPLAVQKADTVTPIAQAIVNAGEELGYKVIDYNGESQIGFGFVQSTIRNGRRSSTANAFLYPVRKRQNLDVAIGITVRSVQLQGNRVTGVFIVPSNQSESYKPGMEKLIPCNKEVILSAGVIETPKILMLSGIGPNSELQQHSISVNKLLPVGKNLHDHITIPIPVILRKIPADTPSPLTFVPDVVDSLETWLQYYVNRSGPLATSGAEVTAFINTGHLKQPNLQFLFFGFTLNAEHLRFFSFTDEGIQLLWGQELNEDKDNIGFLVLPILLHPVSTGYIKLRDASPFTKPIINPNYLEREEDVEALLQGIRFVQKILKSKTLSQFHPWIPTKNNSIHPFDTDAYWRWYIRQTTLTANHPVGTCKMGEKRDPTAVVNENLMVLGFQNLRVVDASVMPKIISGNTNAPTVMIAEKAADIIKSKNSKFNT